LSRLISRGVWDCRLQFRNGFYYAAIAVAVTLTGVLAWVPREQTVWILPVALLGNLATNGFYFMAAIVLLEKAEHSLDAQLVTPLRPWEYLSARVASLCLLSLAESMAIVALSYEGSVDWFAFALGVVLMTSVFACCGFLLVTRYESINEFLFPSFLVSALLSLPLLNLLDVWPSTLWYLHPLHASLELIRAGFEPLPTVHRGGAVVIAVVWVAVLYVSCARAFRHFRDEAVHAA
jgi:fluoroquinolone transport system permease protein